MNACRDSPSFRLTAGGPDASIEEAEWNNTVWSCADWAGYECAIGGWGLSPSAGAKLRDHCGESCLDGHCHAMGHALPRKKTVFVFGLESSGTRFVSRGIAQQLNPATRWDGQSPPCWSYRGHRVIHVSLPHGMYCSAEDLERPASIVQDADVMCKPWVRPVSNDSRVRWIANITATLAATPDSHAVVVTRPMVFQRLSKLSNHGCGTQQPMTSIDQSTLHVLWDEQRNDWVRLASPAAGEPAEEQRRQKDMALFRWKQQLAWRREDALSRQSIAHALQSDATRAQVLVVPYDEMQWLGQYHWSRIRQHIGAHEGADAPPAVEGVPHFASGDRRWLHRKHLPDLMRVAAVEPRIEWDDAAAHAALELVPSEGTAAHAAEAAAVGGGGAHAAKPHNSFSEDLALYLRAEADAHTEALRLERDRTRDAEIEQLAASLDAATASLGESRALARALLALLTVLVNLVVWLCVLPASPVPRARQQLLRRARRLRLEACPPARHAVARDVSQRAAVYGLELRTTDFGLWVTAHRHAGTCDWTCSGLVRFPEAGSVQDGGPFARAGGHEGDVLIRVGSRWVDQPADALACLEEEAVYAHQQARPAVGLRAQQRSSNGGSADGGDGAIDDGPRILVEVVSAQDARKVLGEVGHDEGPRWIDLWRWMRRDLLPALRSRWPQWLGGRRRRPCAPCCSELVLGPGELKAL